MVTASWLDLFFLSCAYLGAGLWVYRAWPRPEETLFSDEDLTSSNLDSLPKVSIIVPARNEERSLPILLRSLKELDYPDYEILVVDDESVDRTRSVAESFGVRVIAGTARPEGWAGKPWACHQGSQQASGDFLLFTDADTMHLPDSLQRSIQFILTSKADLISATPYHANHHAWARMLGPFQSILFALTGPYQPPQPTRLFAIGQYLLFRRDYYTRSQGHLAVCDEFAEDLALAKHCLNLGSRYRLHWGRTWYHVDMYETFGDFLRGWRRNFRQGMKHSGRWVFWETSLLIFALLGAGQWGQTTWAWLPTVVSLAVISKMQRGLGRFSPLGLLFFPFGLMVFIWTSLGAAMDRLLGRQLIWKQRSYVSALVQEKGK